MKRNFPRTLTLLLLILSAIGSLPGQDKANRPYEFYVSPQGSNTGSGTWAEPVSLSGVRDLVRRINAHMDRDIVVYLRGGDYRLREPWKLENMDSGFNGHRVIYQNYADEKPIIMGSVRVDEFTQESPGLVRAQVGQQIIHTLFVNGRRATLARTPNAGFYEKISSWDDVHREIVIPLHTGVDWSSLQGFDIVTHRNWAGTYLRIASLTVKDGEVRLAPEEPWRTSIFSRPVPHSRPGQPYFLENARAFLDAEGEWFHDGKTGALYYKLRAGEEMPKLTIEVPTTETLLEITGTPALIVHDITFEGLEFRYSAWNYRAEKKGMTEGQNGWIYTSETNGPRYYFQSHKGAASFVGAERIHVRRSIFAGLGGAGLVMANRTHDCLIEGNLFYDIGGCGIMLGEPTDWQAKAWWPANPRDVPSGHVVRNNLIAKTGAEYFSSSSISAAYIRDVVIEHNDVSDNPYSGISVGSGWTAATHATEHNIVRGNRIHEVMNVVDDGGGIYTLSAQPGTRIERNYVFAIQRSAVAQGNPVAGIYFDEGSSYISLRDNVVEMDENREQRTVRFNFHKNGINDIGTNGVDFPEAERVKAEAGIAPQIRDRLGDQLKRLLLGTAN